MTTQSSTPAITLLSLWILLSNSHGSRALNLSSAATCSPSITNDDIWCAAADSPGSSTLITDLIVDIDCSRTNQITVRYPDIKQRHGITTPYELLLNCSSNSFQNESFCLLWYFGDADVTGLYILNDEDNIAIRPGATCTVTTCFTTDAYDPYYRTPPISCRHPPASLTTGVMATTTTVPTSTSDSAGESSIAATPTIVELSTSVITTTTTDTHALTGGKPITTPTFTTKYNRPSIGTATVSSSFTIDYETESLGPSVDMREQSGIIPILPAILGTTFIIILMLSVSVWVWYQKSRRSRNKIFFVYNKKDMVFDPLHAPVSIETPAAFQFDKMSAFSVDVVQSLNPTNQIPFRDSIHSTPVHFNSFSTSTSDPNFTDKCHFESSICYDKLGSHSGGKAPTEGDDDSDEGMSISVNGPHIIADRMVCTSDSESTKSKYEEDHKKLSLISLNDSAMGSDDFSIHTPISSQDFSSGVPYCHLKSQCVQHYWNSSPQKTMVNEGVTKSDKGLQDCQTFDDFSENLTDTGQLVDTILLSQSTESKDNQLPSHLQLKDDFKLLLSEKDVDNEGKVTGPPFILSEENPNEEKTHMPRSSTEYIQSHLETKQTNERDNFEDDIALDLTTEYDSEYGTVESINVNGSLEHSLQLSFSFENENIQCRHLPSDNENSDVKCNHLPDESLYTLSTCAKSKHVDIQARDTSTMTMLNNNSINRKADGILSTQRCRLDSRCSSNESGYCGYVSSYDLESSIENTLHTNIATGFDTLELDMISSQ